MAESFLFNIAERVLEKIAFLVGEALSSANVKSDLRKLQETMSTFKAVLLDAERQQQQNERLRLCMWKLRDIFYDAEDVLDEFECEAVRKKDMNHPSSSKKVPFMPSCSFPLPFSDISVRIGPKIRKINERFDKITAEWTLFNLGQKVDNRLVIHRETHSYVNSSDVIGRDEDKRKIVKLLMKPSTSSNISVIPIVGIGGLGKTMFTQFVYNDKDVAKFFPLRIWVCVGEEFDLTRLLKEIIYSITKEKCDDKTLDALQTLVRSLLVNKKFLLVLDDVWNENRAKWVGLRDLLTLSDLPGNENKIIVTTRSFKVASIMSSLLPYELKGLPYKDCLTLFKKWAFNDGDERQHQDLMSIGEEIVKKCRGIPLAVRTLGSLLFSKTDKSEWISIRDSEIWKLEQSENDILPVLKLSYNYLPPYLQRCLACLSLYKKDHLHHSDDVILFWMANGLLEHPKQKEEWEDVGKRYLKELWSRCFIQDVDHIRYYYFKFKVHDLIHDLALDVSQKECKSLYSQTEPSFDEKVRHVSFCDDQPLLKCPQALKNIKHLRTVFVQHSSNIIDLPFVDFCVSNFKYLRALNLSDSSLTALPDCIGTLKHLRYLDLRGCRFIRKLPDSFYKLRSLVMLKMKGVFSVQLHKMQSFVRLRCLEISIGALHLKGIQPGCWSSLQYLGLFMCDFEHLFEGIQYLTSLRTLNLFHCPKLVSLPRSLKFLTKLEHLLIQRCGAINLSMEPEDEEDQHLQLSLKTFSVWQSDALTDLPRLLLEGSSSTLQWITLFRCYNLEVLPEWLQNLTSLQELEIVECPKLSSLPQGMNRLTELKQLKVIGCPTLIERCQRDGGADWPKIAHVQDVTLI